MSSPPMLALLSAAGAAPPLIAPTLPELHAEVAQLTAQVSEAEAVQQALQRTHNHLAVRLTEGTIRCEDADFATHAARTVPLGRALRDRVQAARAQRDRLDVLQAAPTITPALTEADAATLAALTAQVAHLERGYLELFGWQHTHLQRWLSRCSPPLTVGDGLPDPLPLRAERPVAVLAVGDGVVCPGEWPAAGVILLAAGRGCYSEGGCDCTPAPVLPGAVLGRSQSGSAE